MARPLRLVRSSLALDLRNETIEEEVAEVTDAGGMYTLDGEAAAGLDDVVLVHHLAGFVDAGSAGRLATAHLLETLDSRPVARFDVDRLIDYRSRRPAMIFVEDHWESYADPELVLHRVTDARGQDFLLLAGPEPDVQWEAFTDAVLGLTDQLGVRLALGLNSIPMAVPHTRPTGLTAHATRPELVAGFEKWVATVHVPGYVGALIEFRLGQAGRDAIGFAVHVPHYLAQTDYPEAAATLLDSVSRTSGLSLPTDQLREAAAETRAQVDAQVAESDEVAAVVGALEQQYDSFVAARGRPSLLTDADGELPTGDELAVELERFLAEEDGRGGSGPS